MFVVAGWHCDVGSPLVMLFPFKERRCYEMSRPEPASFKSQERNTVLLSSVQLGDGFNGESENNNHQMLRRVIFGEKPHRKLEKPH
jgi:hypothetical protein